MDTANNHYVEPKTQPSKLARHKVLGPFIGATLGFVISMIVAAPLFFWTLVPNAEILLPLSLPGAILIGPGLLATFLLVPDLSVFFPPGYTNPAGIIGIASCISSLPLMVIGAFLGSYKKYWTIAGIAMFVLYCLFMLITSSYWLGLWAS